MTARQFIKQVLRPFKWLLTLQIALAFSWACGNGLTAHLQGYIVDCIENVATPQSAWRTLLPPVIGMMLLSTYINLSYRVSEYFWLKIQPNLAAALTKNLMDRLMHARDIVEAHHLAGSLGNQLKNVLTLLPELLEIFVDKFVYCFFALLITSIGFLKLSYYLTAGFLLWIGFTFYLSYTFYPRARQVNVRVADRENGLIDHLVDVLYNLKSVRLFTNSKTEHKHLKRRLDGFVHSFQTRDRYMMRLYLWQGLSFIFYQTACLLILIYYFQQGNVTTRHFVFVLWLNVEVLEILWELTENVRQFSDDLGRVGRSLTGLLEVSAPPAHQPTKVLRVTAGEIAFKEVSFTYSPEAPLLFDQLFLTIKPGSKVGLVGYSGSGKTTLARLMLGLCSPQQGTICIDGQDIQTVSARSLHQSIGFMPQSTRLFSRSLRENIAYGRMEAPEEVIIQAAQQAQAHGFIMSYPKGYDTLCGKKGVKLSGGQRQRIAIARAFLKNAPILILDEATSQLDTLTMAKIQQSLFALMQGKTTIVLAHRLATLVRMDRILVFDKGKMVQDGTHDALVAQPGLYKALWMGQEAGMLPSVA